MAHQFVGERTRRTLVFLEQRLIQVALAVQLVAIELALREAKLHDPLELGEERFETALRAAVGDQRRQGRERRGPHEESPIGLRRVERRIGPLRDFGEALRQQTREEPIDHALPIRADRALLAGRRHVGHGDRGGGRLAVGRQRVEGLVVRGHREQRPRLRRRGGGNRPEVRLDHRRDDRGIEVADGDHRHQVRTIPIRVELPQPGGGDLLNDLRTADGRSVGIARALQQDRQLRVTQPRCGTQTLPPLFEDDAALPVHGGRLERDVAGPILHDEQRAIDHGGAVGRNLQLVHRLVEARVCVHVRAEPHAERLDERDHVLAGKMLGAVEGHVLDEMRQPPLIVVLEHRPGVDDQPQLGAPARLPVRPHEILQPVGEPAFADLRIDRDDLGQRVGRRRGRRPLGHGDVNRQGGDGEGEQQPARAGDHDTRLHRRHGRPDMSPPVFRSTSVPNQWEEYYLRSENTRTCVSSR